MQSDAESDGPLAGQRLAEARRAREISVLDIAKELHLDEPKVRALENNEFEILGAPVFAKGHLRKYAELVGVPVDDVLADYYTLNRAVGAPPVVGPPRRRQREIRIGPWVVALLVIAAIAGIAYWWLGRTGETAATPPRDAPEVRIEAPASEPPVAELDADVPAADSPPPPGVPSAELAGEPAVQAAPAADEEPAAEPAPPADAAAESAPSPPPAGPVLTLGLSFSGDCWTEVTDASGARLYFDLGRAGRSATVSGEPPLRVLVGNSDNVAITVDGEGFAIPESMRRGQTARLTINAQ